MSTLLLCVLYTRTSQTKQRIFPYMIVTDFFYNHSGECLLRGTHGVLI